MFARAPSVGAAEGNSTALGRALTESMIGSAVGHSTALGLPGIGVAGVAASHSEAIAVGST